MMRTYIPDENQGLTDEQLHELEEASRKPIMFDDDCPEIDPVKTPQLYAALERAAIKRNQKHARQYTQVQE